MYPEAADLAAFWSNIVGGRDSITEVTDDEWSTNLYYDATASGYGKSYSKRGGFITSVASFDPLKYGVMPSAVAGSDPDQLLTLKVAQQAMADAGYATGDKAKSLDRDRAEIIIGRISAPGAGSLNLVHQSKTVHEITEILRAVLPAGNEKILEDAARQIQQNLVPINPDSIPGAMPNVLAGRLAAKLGFRGRNLIVDAACASSMVAVEIAVNDLIEGRCDLALAGGVHVNSSAVLFQMFCGLGALSRKDVIAPFDATADGTMLGEGVGIICLKRYDDAIADGDRIYATICGVATSSDGPGGSVIAPNAEGEALAMQKALRMAGVSPATIELLEAHGTGTPTGDVVELQAVQKVFKNHESIEPAASGWCALGSIKSMIGHTQSASAIAGIIKTALSLHHKILPPTLNVTTPTPKIDWSKHPCYINSKARPWLSNDRKGHPRRAAVSAFGFGGINGHMVLQEEPESATAVHLQQRWENELLTLSAPDRSGLLRQIERLRSYISNKPFALKDLAYTLNCKTQKRDGYRLAIVADDHDRDEARCQDLLTKLDLAHRVIADPQNDKFSESKKGIYFTAPSALLGGKTAFIFPGLGSAYTNMLSDLAVIFPEIRQVFEIVDNVALAAGAKEPPTRTIFPPPFTDGERTRPSALAEADFAVVAVLLAEYSLNHFLEHLEIKPDVIMGCSTGEFAAITTGGSVDVLSVATTFYRLSTEVARSIPADRLAELRSLRVFAPAARVMAMAAAICSKDDPVYLSADLGDEHIIVTGSAAAIDKLNQSLTAAHLPLQPLPEAIPYHTALVQSVMDGKEAEVRAVQVKPLAVPAWSCSTARQYPDDIEGIRSYFTELFTRPVALRQTISEMHQSGVRKFVEVGPNGVLTALISGILPDKPHLAVASNLANRSGLTQIHHLLAALYVQDVPANYNYLYERRAPIELDIDDLSPVPTPSSRLLLKHGELKLLEPLSLVSPIEVEQSLESEDLVMERFLATNASFYSKLNQAAGNVMRGFYEHNYEPPQPELMRPDPAQADHQDLPFLARAQAYQSDTGADVYLTLSLDNDLYLLDHAIGGGVGRRGSADKSLRVHLVPLMVSLEIMAEAAFAHYGQYGDGSLVRIEQVKAFKRLVVDEHNLSLHMMVSNGRDKHGNELSDTIHVEMFEAGDTTSALMMADYVFATTYPTPDAPRIPRTGKPPARLNAPSTYYGPGGDRMFHGPTMQAVQEIQYIDTNTGSRTIGGTASGAPARDWMPAYPIARFIVNPLLLDNASQFVLFYLYEQSLPATALLPFFIQSIDFYRDPHYLPHSVDVSASLSVASDRATEASVEVIADGAPAIRINSINSRRVALSPLWQDFVNDPMHVYLGNQIDYPASIGDNTDGHVLSQVEASVLPQDDVILDWCCDYLFTRAETQIASSNSDKQTKKRKLDRLLGRIAAKEAVRRLIARAPQTDKRVLGPQDLEIFTAADGSPYVVFKDRFLPPVQISISHTADRAVALASFSQTARLGIDLESIRPLEPEFLETFMQPAERQELEALHQDESMLDMEKLPIFIWAAKEALYKANKGKILASTFEFIARDGDGLMHMAEGCDGGIVQAYSMLLGPKKDALVYTLSAPSSKNKSHRRCCQPTRRPQL